jgi:hypothetical protein
MLSRYMSRTGVVCNGDASIARGISCTAAPSEPCVKLNMT